MDDINANQTAVDTERDVYKYVQNAITSTYVYVGSQGFYLNPGNWEIPQIPARGNIPKRWQLHHIRITDDPVKTHIPPKAIAVDMLLQCTLSNGHSYFEGEYDAEYPYAIDYSTVYLAPYPYHSEDGGEGNMVEFSLESYWDLEATQLADKQTFQLLNIDPAVYDDSVSLSIKCFCPIVGYNLEPEGVLEAPNICIIWRSQPNVGISSAGAKSSWRMIGTHLPSDDIEWTLEQ